MYPLVRIECNFEKKIFLELQKSQVSPLTGKSHILHRVIISSVVGCLFSKIHCLQIDNFEANKSYLPQKLQGIGKIESKRWEISLCIILILVLKV